MSAKKVDNDTNPRGQKRPKDGSGAGQGKPGGVHGGKNTEACPDGGPGYGQGGGRGKGRKRAKKALEHIRELLKAYQENSDILLLARIYDLMDEIKKGMEVDNEKE